jgi:hypothetical protein
MAMKLLSGVEIRRSSTLSNDAVSVSKTCFGISWRHQVRQLVGFAGLLSITYQLLTLANLLFCAKSIGLIDGSDCQRQALQDCSGMSKSVRCPLHRFTQP